MRESGAAFLCGEVVAFCNVGLVVTKAHGAGAQPFPMEGRDLQIAIAAPADGRLHHKDWLELGGYSDIHANIPWLADEVVGTLEVENQPDAQAGLDAMLYLMAGHRMTELAESRSGLLTGWHRSSRVSHIADTAPAGTLLSMGICEIETVLKGRNHDFEELLRDVPGPAQIVFVPDQVLVPSARVIIEQIRRTPEERARLVASLRGFIAGEEGASRMQGWFFAAALANALGASPTTTGHDVLSRNGISRAAPPDAILLTARAETAMAVRHRETGCTFSFHGYRLHDAGPAFTQWLKANCDIVRKSASDILRDYEELLHTLRERNPRVQLLVSNITSTSGEDEVQCYAGLDSPPRSVIAKEANLALATLAQRHDVAVIDIDAIAADVGIARHSRGGLHHDGVMGGAIRDELVQVLAARRVPGFF